jgi:hypothetical protein
LGATIPAIVAVIFTVILLIERAHGGYRAARVT